MKKLLFLTTTVITLGLIPAFAQFGPHAGGGSSQFNAVTAKLFGKNQTFTAQLELQTTTPAGDNMSAPGKLSYDTGKVRFEVDATQLKSSKMPPNAAQQLKAMGMDTMITISRPDLMSTYLVYPGLNSYVEVKNQDNTSTNPDDYKVEITENGKETVDGHDCVKNTVTVTGPDGVKHMSTVWNASDLKNFPVKIETSEQGQQSTMLFKNVSLTQPDSSLFNVPAGLTKYTNPQTMMQTEVMKKMGAGGAGGMPPQH